LGQALWQGRPVAAPLPADPVALALENARLRRELETVSRQRYILKKALGILGQEPGTLPNASRTESRKTVPRLTPCFLTTSKPLQSQRLSPTSLWTEQPIARAVFVLGNESESPMRRRAVPNQREKVRQHRSVVSIV
jgi:hypothetical protein